MNTHFFDLTKQAALEAARSYFQPLGWLYHRSDSKLSGTQKASSTGRDVSKLIASEVTYEDIDHLRSLRMLKKELDRSINIDISFAREDILYAKLLSEVLESKKIKTHLKKSWIKNSFPSIEKDIEVVIWSRNYSRLGGLRNISVSSTTVPFITMIVDSSELSSEYTDRSEKIDVSGESVSAAASSLIQKSLLVLQKKIESSSS